MNVNIQRTITITESLSDDDYAVELKVDSPDEEDSDFPYTLDLNGAGDLLLRESDLTKLSRMFAKAKKLYKEACANA
jgi:hypothetical protein